MARMYVAVPYDYLEEMETLSDAEFGRLVRALIAYSRDGAEPALSGNERIVWPRVKMQEDRLKANYEESAQAHAEAGKKGGRPKNQTKPNESKNNQMVFQETNQNQTKPNESKKTYTKTKTNTDSYCCSSSGGDAHARDPDLARVIDYYAQKINATFGRAESDGIIEHYKATCADVVIYAIDIALAAGKPTWAYTKGILRRWEQQGAKTLADVQRIEAEHQAQRRNSPAPRRNGSPSWQQENPFLEMMRNDLDNGGST